MAGDPMSTACGECGVKKNVMKLCTRCKAVYYCSVECQRKSWGTHKKDCASAPTPGGPDEAAKPKGAAVTGQTKKQHVSSRAVPGVCRECDGSGTVDVHDTSASVPLERIQGGAAGFVVRQRSCLKCEGSGVVHTHMVVEEEKPVVPACYICQAPYGTPCACNGRDMATS
uniref:MYND-type domain-containing protein n=2 Tax=Hemiselmis andersenii TaxID=464988 RepID=A0A6U2IU73_HEMAN|mmetsp:Transcript_7677/g.17573  ORF Transcript_7677/g.17573 Transcript_7677/m.17573 type:complete len:170 (+) Transcript_7677:26-535(+)|eukprot:CAMPEP_0172018892 /NCGR_PEP_ID=MMETSP1041-20130122/12346_1 /TAXON_ID=464988 /ORGANISM="Hemiselmis andersenii, Strain CCMP439" /LENGTH=169 /DNA_ID=CAMNT_0012674031 /DNA_START=13 /DNA_END=522 /DNA_ORIENTATION=+